MKMNFPHLALLASFFSVFTMPEAKAQNYLDLAGLSPYTQYKTFETEHFTFIYQEGYFNFASRAAAHIEHAHEVLSPILKWQPRFKTTVLVADNADSANGFTMPALRVGIVLIATPPEEWFSTSYADDWIKLLVFHEYTHMLNIDATRGIIEAARIFFGDVIRPNGLWPTWMLEGLAVYYETRTSKMGRGRSPYYDGILRAYLNENRLGTRDHHGITLDRMNGPDPFFPGGEIPYLFGYHMWDEFSKDHSKYADTDSAMGELSYRSAGRIPYFLEGNLENVMDKNWIDYWNSFMDDSTKRLGAQIETVKKAGVSQADILTHTGNSSFLGALSPDGQWLAYTENSLDDQSRLVLINLKTQETRRLEEKTLGVGMSFTPDSKRLIYSQLIRKDTYSLFSDLYLYDIEHDKTIALSSGLRGKDPTLSADGTQVVFVRSVKATNILSTATLTEENGKPVLKNIKTVYTPPEFSIVSNPRFLNSGEVIFSKQEIGQTQSDLITLSLANGQVHTLLANGAINRTPFLKNGKIYFVSDKSGIENVYEMSESGGGVKPVTNVITSAALPAFGADGSLYASLLSADGYEIARFQDSRAKDQPLANVRNPAAPSTLPQALTEPTLKFSEADSKDYSPWSSMAPRQWAPVALVTYNSLYGASVIGTLLGFDSTGKHQYFGYAGYNFLPNTFDGEFSYTYYGFRPIVSLTGSSSTTFISNDGSQYEKSSQIVLSLTYPIRYTYSSLTPSVYGFVDWNRIYDLNSHVPVASGDFEYSNPLVPGVGTSLTFTDTETSTLAFMPEHGNTVMLAAEDRVDVDRFSVIKYLASYTHYFDLGDHAVLQPKFRMLGSTHPTGFDPAGFDQSFARVQGKNTYDIYDNGQYLNLDVVGIRGYSDEVIETKQAFVGGLDFHFPIVKPYAGLHNTLPFFLKQLHGFVFAETAFLPNVSYTNYNNLWLPSFGGGLSADTQLLIDLPITINFQVQNGTRQDLGGDTLFFFSLASGSLF